MEVLDHLADLSQPAKRSAAATKLAAHFGANHFILFILDPEVNTMLPGPGFPQTLPEGKLWQAFLKMASLQPHEANLPFPVKTEWQLSFGFPVGNDSVAVFIGASPDKDGLDLLNKVLP